LRCVRFSDLKSRTTSTPSQLNVRSNEVETSLGEEPARGDWPQSLGPARWIALTHQT